MINISIERLEEIQAEREATTYNPEFQRWVNLLNVSARLEKKCIEAERMMRLISENKLTKSW